jgi:hypothetical protein
MNGTRVAAPVSCRRPFAGAAASLGDETDVEMGIGMRRARLGLVLVGMVASTAGLALGGCGDNSNGGPQDAGPDRAASMDSSTADHAVDTGADATSDTGKDGPTGDARPDAGDTGSEGGDARPDGTSPEAGEGGPEAGDAGPEAGDGGGEAGDAHADGGEAGPVDAADGG